MKQSYLKYLSNTPSTQLSRNSKFGRMKKRWTRSRVGQPCYLCGVTTTGGSVAPGEKPLLSHISLEHYVPVWFLKAIKLPEGIIHKPNFRVCCIRCNYGRSFKVTTVGELRADIGDELVDKLMVVSGVHLPDHYHYKYKLKTPAK